MAPRRPKSGKPTATRSVTRTQLTSAGLHGPQEAGGCVIRSNSGTEYRLLRPLGDGGFRVAYLARLPSGGPPKPVCVKLSDDRPPWHREWHLGELLRGNNRTHRYLPTVTRAPTVFPAPMPRQT